ncbi:MAG: phenylalanine--tRNA ligase subunit alpha [Bacillota bacterium]
MLNETIKQIQLDCNALIASATTSATLTEAKVKFLGKNGAFTGLLKSLKSVPPAEKPAMGKLLNEVRTELETAFATAEQSIKDKERAERVQKEALDVTLSLNNDKARGALHPLSIVKNDIINIFAGMGFQVKDGPEIDLAYYNFTALNIPDDHPSRASSDTFYINDEMLLRTQTSTIQVHVMENEQLPIRIICPGKVYRADDDATHSPMFSQVEGLVVDKHITLSDLKGVLDEFAKAFFDAETRTRFRPSHFPFTEPSVEVDLSCAMCGGKGCRLCKGTGWIELLGAGIVNPAVLEMCGIDSKEYSGFAFGMGVERATMVKYGIPDMRLIFDNDIRYLKQFK